MAAIFVFGSNTEGRHGKGAALVARKQYGAIYGQASGRQGNSYAIITKDLSKGLRSIPLQNIKRDIEIFLSYAQEHQEDVFEISPLGCGLAGYKVEEIAPMFKYHSTNVLLPDVFLQVLNKSTAQ